MHLNMLHSVHQRFRPSKGIASGKEAACQCRRHKRHRFNLSVEEILWRRAWQPTAVFLPGESHGQRSLAGYSPWCHRVRHDWSDLAHTHKRTAMLVLESKSLKIPRNTRLVPRSITHSWFPCELSFQTLKIQDMKVGWLWRVWFPHKQAKCSIGVFKDTLDFKCNIF